MAKRILLVEDNKDARSILVLVLRSLGYETIEARTGAEGVEKALFDNPNLIVMDMSLPDMNRYRCSSGNKKESKHRAFAHHCLFRLERAHMDGPSGECGDSGLPDKARFDGNNERNDREIHSAVTLPLIS